MIKILFLAANPLNTDRLRLDEEMRAIDIALRQSEFRDQVDIRSHWAVRISDLQELLLRHQPDVVHFSGHGSDQTELILEDSTGTSQPVPASALRQLFSILNDNIRCVVLNACYSEPQAKAIAKHIDCVVGMSDGISDEISLNFSAAFYRALGYGRSIQTAFELGRSQINLESLGEQNVPQLLVRKGKPAEIALVNNVTESIWDQPVSLDNLSDSSHIKIDKKIGGHRSSTIRVFYQNIERFLVQHYRLFATIIICEIALAILFYQYKDWYKISWFFYLSLALLLIGVIWGWYKVWTAQSSNISIRNSLLLSLIFTVASGSLIGFQVQESLKPLSQDKFGIAVATFGKGPDFQEMRDARELSEILYEDMRNAVRDTPELSGKIDLIQLGIIQNESQGEQEGKRVGAELILWGRKLESDGGAILHLHVLEAPGFTNDSSSPRVLPVDPPLMHLSFNISDSDNLTIKKQVRYPSLGLAAFCLGLFYYLEDQRFALAAEQFEVAIQFFRNIELSNTETDLGLIYYYLGRSYQLVGKYEQSQEMLQHAAHIRAEEPAMILGQVYNFNAMGQEEQKGLALDKVIELSNQYSRDNIAATYNRALAYEELEDHEHALREYRAILKCNQSDFANCQSDFFIAYLSAASVLIELNRIDDARLLYDRAEILAQGNSGKTVGFTLALGNYYEQIGELKNAEQAYSKAIALNPLLATPYLYRARLQDTRNISDRAFLDYQKATELSNNKSHAYTLFAEFLHRIGSYELAIENFYEALRHPTYDESLIHAFLGNVYADKQDEERSLSEFETALVSPGPSEYYIRAEYGRILTKFGHIADAIAEFERSLELNPSVDGSTTLNLGQLYESVGQKNRAKQLYKSLMDLSDQISENELKILQSRLDSLNAESGANPSSGPVDRSRMLPER